VKLTVVGCSPSWPNPGSAHSGYLLEDDGKKLLVDCGPGVLPRLREAEGWPHVEAIVITHFHLDHCGDLVAWLWGHLSGPLRGRPGPDLWLPPGGRGDLAQLAPRFDEVFTAQEYAEDEPFAVTGFTVTPQAVAHYDQPTFGLRVEAGAKTVAFSADSGPTPALVELARDSDLFLCEATLGEPEGELRGHLEAREAAAIALQANAKRMLLVHRPSELPAPDGMEVAYDGLEIRL
jgi:ribonuclease BN (tRNA processing enzyme)